MKKSCNDFLNNKYPNNPKITGNETKVATHYIVCAAIWFQDGKQYQHQPRNIESGIVVCGRRHHNCYLTAFELSMDKQAYGKIDNKQGFITSNDIFVERKEAAEIAFKAGQTKDLKEILFSEDLY